MCCKKFDYECGKRKNVKQSNNIIKKNEEESLRGSMDAKNDKN